VFLSILAATDGSPSARAAVRHAADLAHAFNAKLTLITVVPPISTYVTLAGVPPERMHLELERWATNVLAEAAASVPDDVIVHRVQPTGHPGPEIMKAIRRGDYDLVVLGTRGRNRTQEGLLGTVNGFLHFHAPLPILSIPDPKEHA
jgi:nucleotide-binding universal stress UspA family protein